MDNTYLIIILVLIGLLVSKEVVLWLFKRVAPKWFGDDRFDSIDKQLYKIDTNHFVHVQDTLSNIEKNTEGMCRKMETINRDLQDIHKRVINIQTDGVRSKNGNNK